jgi:hypothetical protein
MMIRMVFSMQRGQMHILSRMINLETIFKNKASKWHKIREQVWQFYLLKVEMEMNIKLKHKRENG